jgi:hypothetical protein
MVVPVSTDLMAVLVGVLGVVMVVPVSTDLMAVLVGVLVDVLTRRVAVVAIDMVMVCMRFIGALVVMT